jgi:hypothetical protein
VQKLIFALSLYEIRRAYLEDDTVGLHIVISDLPHGQNQTDSCDSLPTEVSHFEFIRAQFSTFNVTYVHLETVTFKKFIF